MRLPDTASSPPDMRPRIRCIGRPCRHHRSYTPSCHRTRCHPVRSDSSSRRSTDRTRRASDTHRSPRSRRERRRRFRRYTCRRSCNRCRRRTSCHPARWDSSMCPTPDRKRPPRDTRPRHRTSPDSHPCTRRLRTYLSACRHCRRCTRCRPAPSGSSTRRSQNRRRRVHGTHRRRHMSPDSHRRTRRRDSYPTGYTRRRRRRPCHPRRRSAA